MWLFVLSHKTGLLSVLAQNEKRGLQSMADVSIEKLASLTGTENKAGIETLNASMNFSQRI